MIPKKFRGGGFLGKSFQDATSVFNGTGFNMLNRGATWPFYSLTLGKNELELSTPWKKIHKSYAEISNVRLSRLGYLIFLFKDGRDAFGFGNWNISKVIKLLESYNVKISNNSASIVVFTKTVLLLQIIIALAVLSLIIGSLAGIIK